MADDIIRADQIGAEISSSSVVNIHGECDMLHALEVGLLEHVLSDLESH